jgi:type IV secretion/conjugal transfer VirB4 family ATPase
MIRLSEFRSKAKGLADLLNYAALVDEGILICKDGSLTAAWGYRGDDFESASAGELAGVSASINSVLCQLGGGWMIHVDAIRSPSVAYPSQGNFPDRTSRLIDDERRTQYRTAGTHFETRYVLTLSYLAPTDDDERVGGYFVGWETSDKHTGSRALASFRQGLAQIEDGLGSLLKMKRMRSRPSQNRAALWNDLLGHINACISGDDHPVLQPPTPMYLDTILGSQDFYGDLRPRIGPKHIRPVSIVGYPQHSYPGMSDALQRLPFAYRWSSRFIFLDPTVAEKHIASYEKKWFGRRKSLRSLIAEQSGGHSGPVNAYADTMASDAQGALAECASGSVRFGYFTNVVIVMDEDAAVVDQNAREVVKAINNAGFNARLEDVNAVEAYLGSLPGHGHPNVRRPLMHTLNVSDILPMTAIWSGPRTHPCPFYTENSPPLAYVGTGGATPFRLTLHVDDVGHALVLGPTGSGKSTLLGFLMAQHFRYPGAQVFAFDKGFSAYVLCKACGGEHYAIAGDNIDLSFCPLAKIDEPGERTWAIEWLEILVSLQGLAIGPHHRAALAKAVSLLANSEHRTLTDFVSTLQDVELRDGLAHYTLSGSMGNLLDSDRDALGLSDFQVFEMEHLLGLGPKDVIPVLLYLFHRIERRLQGQPTLIVIDEAWLMLTSELFQSKIRDWLKTLRKANAAVVFATHSPTDILNSRIANAIVESCPTKFWLPNAEAKTPTLAAAYASLGMTDRQIHRIASAVPKRHYYYTSPMGRRLIDLDLGATALSFTGAAGKQDLRAVKTLQERHGEAWPAAWLQTRGLTDAARTWLGYESDSLATHSQRCTD